MNLKLVGVIILIVSVVGIFVFAEELITNSVENQTIPIDNTTLSISPPELVPASSTNSDKLQEIEECQDVPYQEEERIYGNCTADFLVKVCDDEPANTSCHEQPFIYKCFKEIKKIDKTKQECTPVNLIVNQAVKIDVKDYSCSSEENGEEIILVCDSKYDGNGDGKCTSGESCLRYVVNGKNYQQYEKNSNENFEESDGSFFLEEAKVEVLK